MHFDSLSQQLHLPEEFEPVEPRDNANRRLVGGVLISLLLHALILSLQFGIPGLDLPSLELPWKERRKAVESIQIQIANPAPSNKPAPVAPAVTVTELFKMPDPILPSPPLKTSGGLVVLPSPAPVVPPQGLNKPSTKQARAIKSREIPSAPALVKKVLPVPEAPVRIIAQDQIKNDDFVVPVSSEEELDRKREDKKESKRQAEPIPADAIVDKDAETQLIEEQKRAELAAKKVQDELQLKKQQEEKLRQLAEQKRQDEIKAQQAIAKANEEQQRKLAKLLEESVRKPSEIAPIDPVRELNEQKQLAKQRAAQELAKREQEQAIEEALKESKRQELLAQETLRKEEQRRQAEQQRQRQLALEQEQQKQAAAQLRQQQLAEQEKIEKQQALALAEKKLQEQKQLEQKQLEQRLAEQKVLEQKLAEQRLAEQKLAEQRIQEQRLAEQRQAEQKIAERRAAEKAANEKAANEKAAAEAAVAKAIADRAAAQSSQGNGSRNATNSSNANGTGTASGTGNTSVTSNNPVQNLGAGDLTSRLRDQARGGDLLKPRMPLTKGVEDNPRARRRSFLGAYDKEVPLRMYIDSVKAKAERNGNLIYEKRSLSSAEYAVILNIVIKSDGSIEEVTILRSSGNRSIDERARNIALTNAPYSVFPPALAAKYDVIELKHFWVFGDRLRILDDLPQF